MDEQKPRAFSERFPVLSSIGDGLFVAVASIPFLLFGLGYLVWEAIAGGDVHPEDRNLPLHKQRVKMGNPIYGPMSYGPRWGAWIGVAPLVALPIVIFLFWLFG